MPDLPARPDLAQLRTQAKELLRAARRDDDTLTLAAAQFAVARDHGFASWPKLKAEVERRAILDSGDADRLAALVAADPSAAVAEMEHWCDHPLGAAPLSYVAMLRYDTASGVWRDVPGTAAMARALLAAGAPVDGHPDDSETPLITAASYGDAEVARVLIDAGADIEATSSPTSGGVPGGTALRHAAVFGMTAVVDVLVAAGARIGSITQAAAAGDITGWLRSPVTDRVRALVMAADHERLRVIETLVAAGTPVDAVDELWGGQPLWTAAENGRPESVRTLLGLGADPTLRDSDGRTALDRCRAARSGHQDRRGHDQVEKLLSR